MGQLAIETSARYGCVAVRSGERTLSLTLSSDRAHASDLLPAIVSLLDELGVSPRALDAIAVGLGPGSFTGLRVGIATALGLAVGSSARLCGVPSGESLAYATLQPGDEALWIHDARRGAHAFAHYRRIEDDVEVVAAPRLASAEELADLLRADVTIFADEPSAELACVRDLDSVRVGLDTPATATLELGLRRLARFGPHDPQSLEPLYLRPFAANPKRR